MSVHWKDWLPPMCRDWARQKLRILSGGRVVKNHDGSEGWHFDGLPMATVLGRIKSEGEGASQTVSKQRFAEVYSGDARLIWQAIEGLRFEPRQVFYVQYLVVGGYREKAEALDLTRSAWWQLHDEAHVWIAAGISFLEAARTSKAASKVAGPRHTLGNKHVQRT